MRLHLIRHAVTAETGRELSGRLPGIGLSDDGRAMAKALASHLEDLRLVALYTSPIQRCRETAAELAEGRGLKARVDRAFIEADYGRWSGRTLASLRRLKAWGGLMGAASRFRFPDGETLAEVQSRAVGGVEELAVRHPRGNVGLVSHADVIRVILAHYLGMPLDLVHRLDVLPASVSILDLSGAGPGRVPVINHVADPAGWR
jgi:probable phosphoglycerate mutase